MKISRFFDPTYIYNRRGAIVPFLASRFLRFLALRGLVLGENDRLLASLRNRHQGERCFVIGNGPSLTINDLEILHKNAEISIASNKIYLAFPETDWRPDYYTVADLPTVENNALTIRKLELTKLFHEEFKTIVGASGEMGSRGTHLFFRVLEPDYAGQNPVACFSGDAISGFYASHTVTSLNIQLAYYLGCNPIYLIGLDGTYTIPLIKTKHHQYGQIAVSQGETNHFHKDYRAKGETWSIPDTEQHLLAYGCCRAFLDAKNVEVVNVSRKTQIEIFTKDDFDRLF